MQTCSSKGAVAWVEVVVGVGAGVGVGGGGVEQIPPTFSPLPPQRFSVDENSVLSIIFPVFITKWNAVILTAMNAEHSKNIRVLSLLRRSGGVCRQDDGVPF